jgi:hypothetical protein
MTDGIDRYGPLGFYHLAEDFCRAAVHSANLENTKPRLHYNLVLYHLHTHSIELTLKAFLRAKGIDAKETKKQILARDDGADSGGHRAQVESQETETIVADLGAPRSAREGTDVPIL